MYPLSQMRQRRPFLVFELNKIATELFKSNLLCLVVSTFAPEWDYSGRGGSGGLILESWFCGFPSKPARKQSLFFKIILFFNYCLFKRHLVSCSCKYLSVSQGKSWWSKKSVNILSYILILEFLHNISDVIFHHHITFLAKS